MGSRIKSICYLVCTIGTILILWCCHDQLVVFAISISKAENSLDQDQLRSEAYDRFSNIVIYGGIGFILFNMMSSIRHFMKYKNALASEILKYFYLLVLVLQVFFAFVSVDIVLQNWQGNNVSIGNFTMRYQGIGGLVGVAVLAVRQFFVRNRKGLGD